MKQRTIALLLALALLISLGAVSALADDLTTPPAGETGQSDSAPAEEAAGEDRPQEAPVLAGPDLADNVTVEPDALGQVSFANVERRMREKNLQVLTLEQSILSLEDIDYDKLHQQLWETLNQMAQAQWMMVKMSKFMSEYDYNVAYNQMDQAYDAVRDQYEAIEDGDMQKDNADIIRQLKNLQDQIIVAGESLYVALAAMEAQEDSLQRQLEALDRTVEEMELRYTLGQISAMQLAEVKSGRTSLASGLETLRMNVQNYKLQMELLLGAEQTGTIALGPVPAVTAAQLDAMDLEKDLAAAKERSYELYDAAQTLEDARDTYKDEADNWGYNENRMEYRNAKRTWQAAQYTYNNTVQNYELKFRTLYAQVKDYWQVWEAAKVSLACEQSDYNAAQLRYEQGNISENALLTAKDDLTAAAEKVQSAANDLFSTYNSYCWAVQNGILN